MTKNKLILITILFLAFFLRFWRLDSTPALNADEAAIGYNAYSLINTGLDEHGNFWPIHFQSFNDYKPGLYFYLVLPFVKVLGLSEWSVRIPNASLSVLTVLVVYLLVLELFAKQKNSQLISHNSQLGLIAAFLLAISPWHLHFSRGGWEVNTATFFITAGLWLFIRYINDKKFKYLVLSICNLALSLYAYHAARVVVPLLGLGILVIYREEIKKNFKSILLAGLVGFILLIPLTRDLLRSEITSRAAGVGLFADTGPLARINEQRGEHGDYTAVLPRILHNKAVNYSLAFFENWTAHFHGEFLFLSGDLIERDKVPETGQMYLFDIVFVALGLIFLLTSHIVHLKSRLLVLLWLFVSPTAAALTFQAPHALRAENMIIPLVIISALGLYSLIDWGRKSIRNKYLLTFYFLLLTSVIAWQFARYEHMYWIHMAKEYPYSSQYGVKELIDYVSKNQGKYDKVIVTDRYDQPYILFLFYMKYSPVKFQIGHELTPKDKFGFSTVRNFDKYYFKPIEYDIVQPGNPRSLIVGTDSEIPKEANIVKDIYGTNDYLYFRVVAN